MREESISTGQHSISSNVTKYMSSLGIVSKTADNFEKSHRQREKHRKMCEISSRIIKIFEGNDKLRA